MQESVKGIIEHIIFRNEENGYTVLSLRSKGKELTLVGFFQSVNEGESIEAFGRFTAHVSYGEQFKVESYEIREPEGREAVERYLGSGAIKGIGKALAARIVRKFGEETLRILEEEPERLAEIKGISMKKARDIAKQADAQRSQRAAMLFLQQYGVSLALGVKIYTKYGEEMYSILRENPYRMMVLSQRISTESDSRRQTLLPQKSVLPQTRSIAYAVAYFTFSDLPRERAASICPNGI